MKLYPKDVEPVEPAPAPVETSPAKRDEVIAIVKAYVTEPKEYDQIVQHVESTVGLSGIADIYALIDMVKDEWHPTVIEAEPKTVEK